MLKQLLRDNPYDGKNKRKPPFKCYVDLTKKINNLDSEGKTPTVEIDLNSPESKSGEDKFNFDNPNEDNIEKESDKKEKKIGRMGKKKFVMEKLSQYRKTINKVISVDEIRTQVDNDILIKPYEADHKVYIIDESDKMNDQAQNAILKTIEEPPSYGVILLL